MATTLSRPQMCKQATRRQAMILPAYQSSSIADSRVSEDIGYPARRWQEPPDVPADFTASGTSSTYSLVVPSQFGRAHSMELPSPFMRGNERARTASDIVCPESFRFEEGAHR
jgi:hypothetical protein